MEKKLNCIQVNSLLKAYAEDKLSPKLYEYVKKHIKNCTKCKNKAEEIKKTIKNHKTQNNNSEKKEKQKSYDTFKQLSAYMDNELNPSDNIKVKKLTITNSKVRNELESLYKFQKALHYAYQKTKNESKYDYSKSIITQLQDGYEYSTNYFYKLAAIFATLLTAIIFGFIYLYF